ncbi:hypothetical protein BJ508DRAFT_303262 [Ascobolus immersus RN42]|uniref:Uncharacterized protein n=1 Tax=Ascobolus immersus RN42 TaxID=1160509 RepID=A0A3N4IL51_ASCIM|nr:hypothetical protein BJ508DRAFT_303262 [Ascobolus immersus RN42]
MEQTDSLPEPTTAANLLANLGPPAPLSGSVANQPRPKTCKNCFERFYIDPRIKLSYNALPCLNDTAAHCLPYQTQHHTPEDLYELDRRRITEEILLEEYRIKAAYYASQEEAERDGLFYPWAGLVPLEYFRPGVWLKPDAYCLPQVDLPLFPYSTLHGYDASSSEFQLTIDGSPVPSSATVNDPNSNVYGNDLLRATPLHPIPPYTTVRGGNRAPKPIRIRVAHGVASALYGGIRDRQMVVQYVQLHYPDVVEYYEDRPGRLETYVGDCVFRTLRDKGRIDWKGELTEVGRRWIEGGNWSV